MGKKEIKDSLGRVLYFLDEKSDRVNVLNKLGIIVGYIKGGNTYNIHGSLVAKGEAPGELL
ncbi:hypothetical protein QJS83_16970 [Bdellovibrio sp. 22V]|uniref:hypothetical protein n=1 Tax=Bdellovibrio sp. 22V TaxID=3044166 RepID=UPI002542FB84|nr:hypothetical protein [Bdellovibrio sp. 22V]WII72157.1 hypothetical protein QJS83_16970 [Bdellovibrio sp. 22V]